MRRFLRRILREKGVKERFDSQLVHRLILLLSARKENEGFWVGIRVKFERTWSDDQARSRSACWAVLSTDTKSSDFPANQVKKRLALRVNLQQRCQGIVRQLETTFFETFDAMVLGYYLPLQISFQTFSSGPKLILSFSFPWFSRDPSLLSSPFVWGMLDQCLPVTFISHKLTRKKSQNQKPEDIAPSIPSKGKTVRSIRCDPKY